MPPILSRRTATRRGIHRIRGNNTGARHVSLVGARTLGTIAIMGRQTVIWTSVRLVPEDPRLHCASFLHPILLVNFAKRMGD